MTFEAVHATGGDETLWQKIFRVDPYYGFDASCYKEDCSGWGSSHRIFQCLVGAVRPKLIIEVGTWKGASAIQMAETARDLALPTRIICLDTWLGTRESYTWKDSMPSLHDDLQLRYGWPQLYYQFLANVCHRRLQDRILPLPQTSGAGLRLLRDIGVRAELIYLDASHDYEDVKSDLRHAWECLTDNGVLFGDDYLSWHSVTAAVEEFCRERELVLIGTEGKFAIARSGNIVKLFGEWGMVEPDGSCGGLRLQRLHASGDRS